MAKKKKERKDIFYLQKRIIRTKIYIKGQKRTKFDRTKASRGNDRPEEANMHKPSQEMVWYGMILFV